MVGQLHKYLKIFEKFRGFIENPAIREVVDIASKIKTTGTTAYDLFNYGNQLDDPNASTKDKIVSGLHMVTAPLSLVPGIGSTVGLVANNVIDAASYITDVMEGRKDPPPLPADIHNRDNPIGTIANKVMTSTPFKQYFGNFGLF
jgi:hypothetical protein